ncbi:MAG: Gfo/Idh/MocA family oxidoreductase [Armatimonadota bacterium]|jgi:predicted dehydrogenase
MADEKIRTGLIGGGGNMRAHAVGRLSKIPEVEIVAVTEPSKDALGRFLEAAADLKGIPTFAEHEKMLDAVEMDAVVISTPHTTHMKQIEDSIAHDLHVLVEKPMVCTVEDAKKVIELRDKSGKVVEVAYQRHFQAPFRFAREYCQSGKMGPIHFISAFQCQNWWHEQRAKTWRADPDLSGGGQLNDSGSHLVDILLWITDLVPEEVFAYIENRGARVDILSAVSIKFTNGAVGNISVVGEAEIKGMDEGEYIWGKNGYLAITGTGKPELTVWDPEPRAISDKELPKGPASPDHNFIAAILGKEEVEVPAECGLRVIQLSEAVWESARLGQPVAVKG